jgi:hypothetical protein
MYSYLIDAVFTYEKKNPEALEVLIWIFACFTCVFIHSINSTLTSWQLLRIEIAPGGTTGAPPDQR